MKDAIKDIFVWIAFVAGLAIGVFAMSIFNVVNEVKIANEIEKQKPVLIDYKKVRESFDLIGKKLDTLAISVDSLDKKLRRIE